MDYDKAYTIDLSDARAERALNAECETGNWVSYRMPEEKLRGGFRFATVISECPSVVSIKVRQKSIGLEQSMRCEHWPRC
jgi:hypothetical protein